MKNTPHKKIRIIMTLAISGFASLSGQSINNGSFETNSNGATDAYWDKSTDPQNIMADGSGLILSGWDVIRPNTWNSGAGRVDVVQSGSATNVVGTWQYILNGSNGVEQVTDVPGVTPLAGATPTGGGVRYLSLYNDDYNGILPTETTIQQSITGLIAGKQYEVSFSHWAYSTTTPNHGDKLAAWQVNVDGINVHDEVLIQATSGQYQTEGPWSTPENLNLVAGWSEAPYADIMYTDWAETKVTFTASGATALLQFVGLMQGGPTQLALDNIKITEAIPEPSGLMLIAFCSAGLILRRSRVVR